MSILKPKKSLGQNFLRDKNIALKTVNSLAINDDDFVIEIGPGEGALTEHIIKKTKNFVAIELDQRAIEVLSNKFPDLNIIHSDILKFNLSEFIQKNNLKKVKVIGNIPYYISSQIFFVLFENSTIISKAILTIQKEVAQRLSANQKTKDYGILTIARSLVGNSKILFDVPASCFYPPPNVTSSVIEFNFFDNVLMDANFKEIMKLVRAGFNQRRKKLSNALKSYLNSKSQESIFKDIQNSNQFSSFPDLRAEQLTATDFINLYDFINQKSIQK